MGDGSNAVDQAATVSLKKSQGHRRGRQSTPIPPSLRDVRTKRGLSLTELHAQTGIALGRLSMIERGLLMPWQSELAALESFFEFAPHTLSVRTLVVYDPAAVGVRDAA